MSPFDSFANSCCFCGYGCCMHAVLLHITFPCGQQNDGGPDKMNDLTGQLAAYVITRCSCDLTTEYISNSRWVCNSSRPNVVIFRADVSGTTQVNSDEIGAYIIQWAERQNTINVGSTTLQIQGSECQSCTSSPTTGPTTGTTASPVTQPYWVFAIIGVIILILIIAVAVVLIVVCRKNSQQHKSAP